MAFSSVALGSGPDTSGADTLYTAFGKVNANFALAVEASTLGGAASLNVGTAAGTVAAGDDSRITGALAASTAASTYAPLASPGFTGAPTAPTATAGDSTTKLATTAFVQGQGFITSASAPVQSVAGRTGTVTLAVADVSGAAPLASPALTGTPTAPTATAGTNTTQVATTAFVLANASGGSIPIPAIKTGKWIAAPYTSSSTGTMAVNTLYLSPLPIFEAMTIDRLAVRLTAGVAGNMQLGAYTWDGTQFNFISSSNTASISTSVGAVVSAAPTSNIVLSSAKQLFLGAMFDSTATPTAVTWSVGLMQFFGYDDASNLPPTSLLSTSPYIRISAAITYGTWPSTIATTSITPSGSAPGSPIIVARRL